jgi:glycine zipper 2TM protein
MNRSQTILRSACAAALLSCTLYLSGCVEAPPPRPPTPPPPPAQLPPPPPPNTQVFAYPQRGQTPEQQDRDHYECSVWATQQTGFDPSAPGVPPHERVQIVSGPPSGAGTAIGAVTGAIFGAAIARPWQAAPAALAGAVVGGAIGNSVDQANATQTRTVLVPDRRAMAAQEQQAGNYRRALGACLDARGYTVR